MAHPEGRMREIVELLSKFSVDKLNNDWVTHVIDSDFTEVDDLPPDYEDEHVSTNFNGLFSAVIGSCRQWIDSLPNNAEDLAENRVSLNISSISEADRTERDTHTRFWIELSENVKVKSLMALLFYYIHRGQRYDAREKEREFGIQGADLYFLMLCIPGSNAFRIFHPVMYLKALDVLRLTTKLNVALSSPSKKGRGAGGRGSAGSQRAKSHDGPVEEEDDETEMAMLSPHETSRLCRSLNVILHDFLRLTTRFSLKHSPESLDETVSILCDVTCSEIHDARAIFIGRHRPDTVTALTYNAYIALQGLCNPIHGKIRKTVIVIFKYIINNILMTCRGSSNMSVRALGVIKDHSLIFVKYILTQIAEEAHEGVYILAQQLCIRVTDKSEYRQKTATSVVEILRYLPLPLYSRLIKWFHKFSHNEKASHRMFMLEVISKLLGEEERQTEDNESGANGPHFNEDQTPTEHITKEATEGASDAAPQEETNENGAEEGTANGDTHDSSFLNVSVDHSVKRAGEKNILSHRFLLSIIFSRARDNAASVRSKALAMLAECTHSSNPSIIQAMREIFLRPRATVFSTPHIPGANINMESPVNQEDGSEIEGNEIEKDLPNAANVMSMLHRRALDDKVTVRKSALQVLENLMKLDNGMINEKNMEVLMDHCRDPALLVRKEMIKALTNMLETYPELDLTANNWVLGVLPLVLDPEMKVQEMVVTMLDKLLFKRLLPHGCRGSDTAFSKLPWHLLKTVNKNSYHKFFNKTLMLWAKSELMTPGIIRIAQSHIGHENNEGVWTFLAPLSNNMTIKDPTFAVDYFEGNCGTGSEVGTFTLNQVLKVLNNSIKHIPGERSVALQQQLLEHVTNFSVGVELISAMCDTITLLSYSLHGKEKEGQKAIEVWALPILQACDDHLQAVLFSNTNTPLDDVEEEALFRHLFTMGEIAMLIPSKANKRMFLMLQSIIFHTPSKNNNLGTAIPVNDDIPDSQTQRTQPPSTSFIPSPRAQALSVVTLGKMCLQHEDQAKRIIPALGKMLDTTNDSAMKVNIVFTLSDMCVRYATLVDPLLPQVTACLRDPDVVVRRTTLTLVINLLQEDYLKLKGSFYYRILQCLTDEHEDIRDTVVFYVTERLLKRFPKILCQHFIECIFHYNCYEEHEAYNRFHQSAQEKELFGLAGPEHKEERVMLYRFMLEHMPDEQRFATTQRLCQDVLGGVVEGKIKLNAASLPMLQDTLLVLSSDEIKLASLKSRPEDQDQPTDQAEQAAMAGQVIKKTIISQVVKRNVIENIVPILIAMKHKLEEARSPLMKHLLLYLKEVLKDYKNEVKEILAGDKQLAKEIDFDLRRFDQEQREEEEKRVAAAAAEAIIASRPSSPDEDVDSSPSKNAPKTPSRATSGSPRSIKGAPKTPVVSAKELLKQAVLNSKNIAARRNSVAVSNGEEKIVENGGESATSKRRASVADFRNNDVTINADDQSHVDPRPLDGTTILETSQDPERDGNESSEIVMKTPKSNRKLRIQGGTPTSNGATPSSNGTTPKGKTPTREELLRAISTPHAVINNITFMDNTQELSNISMETSSLNQSSEIRNSVDKQPALLLHLMSPEAFANKESDFSKLRRASTRRSLGSVMDKEDEKEKESKKSQGSETVNTSVNTTTATVRGGKKNRKSGGLFESLASQADTESDKSSASQEDTEAESITSELSDDSMSVSSNKSSKKSIDKERDSRESSPSKPSRKESKVRSSKGKRSRVMASLSPDPGNTPNKETNTGPTNVKPSQKKSKKKSK